MRNLILGLLLGFLAGCHPSGPAETGTSTPPPRPEVQKVQMEETRWGKRAWTLEARRVEFRNDTTVLYHLTLHFYDEHEEPTSVLTADSGYLYERTRDMVAFGHVEVLTLEDSTRLLTRSLAWDHQRERIYTFDSVTVYRGTEVLTGVGLISDPALKRIRIGGEVLGKPQEP